MLTLHSEFAGVGGDTLGATRVPYVRPMLAVNHWQVAVDSHAANFPDADHECCDARALGMATMPRADIFWAWPAWSTMDGRAGQEARLRQADRAAERAVRRDAAGRE